MGRLGHQPGGQRRGVSERPGPNTRLVHAGRRKDWTHRPDGKRGIVNPPIWRASTVLFESLAELEASNADPEDGRRRRMRVNIAESPLLMLARRREADGSPFLSPEIVAAGERLREDFELAQMGPRITQNWDRFLTAGVDVSGLPAGFGGGSESARNRVAAALRELGPGMGDMCLRVCCFLEGIEMTERRLGWSARSGKIVLRLALMRLERHYRETYGLGAPLIG